MAWESISKKKNGEDAGPLSLVTEMVKVAVKAGGDIITDPLNQVRAEGIIPTE